MQLPNLKHLQYLLALHKHQHFNRAAQACFVSQSTLSSAILKLEELFNCQLIERDHKAFIFTVDGLKIVELARSLLVSANELVNYANDKSLSTSVRLGCIHTIAPYLLTDLVKSAQQSLPDLTLYLYENSTENLLSLLADGEIDAAIIALPIEQQGFRTKLLGHDPFYIAGEEALVKQCIIDENFSSLPLESVFLLSREHCLSEHAISACQLLDKSTINSFNASSLMTLVQMTSLHKGITLIPKMAVDKGLGKTEGLTIAPLPSHMHRDIGIVWRKTSLRSGLYEALSDIVASTLN